MSYWKHKDYWIRKSKWTKLMSYVALASSVGCILFGMAFFAILLMMLSFHFSQESEMCKLRDTLMQVIHNQNVLIAERNDEKSQATPKR